MNLLYIGSFQFFYENGKTYGLPANSTSFFQKYLDIFTEVRVLGAPLRSYLDKTSLVEITDSRISVRILPPNKSPKDFKNDRIVNSALRDEISEASAVLIKPASRRGMKAIQIAEELKKPYMIEMTGDVHNALKQHPNILKRLYAPIIYMQIRRAIKNCQFGLYVSRDYLQRKYPIKGIMCGCADVILEKSDEKILLNRIQRIEAKKESDVFNICLIGFYQGKMKGVDTAIRALSRLPNNYLLNILGNGTQDNRDKWYTYATKYGISNVKERIKFPKPLPNSNAVLEWLDSQDFFVLPTRSEGFGRCVAEAMSRGCICFATNICTMPELLQENYLHNLGDDKKLAEMILSNSKNKELMKITAQRNFEYAKLYDFGILRDRRNKFLRKFESYCKSFLQNSNDL